MLNYKRIISILISCIFLNGCTTTEYEVPVESNLKSPFSKKKLVEKGRVEIAIDSLTRTNHSAQVIDNGDTTIYIHYNDIKNSFELFKITNHESQFLKKIPISNEGPNAIFDVGDYYFHNKDSIFVLDSGNPLDIVLIGSDGSINDRWSISHVNNKEIFEIPDQGFYNFTFDENKGTLNFWVMPPVYQWAEEYFSNNFAVEYDIVRRKETSYYGSPPLDYQNVNCYYLYEEPARANNEAFDIIKYPGSNEIHVYDRETSTLQKVVIQQADNNIDKIASIMEFGEEKPSINEQRRYRIETPGYFDVVYDKYQEVFILLWKESMPFRNSNNDVTNFSDWRYSLLILDKDLKKIGTYDLGDSFSPMHQIFPTPRGILIGSNNTSNSDFKEDIIQFTLFKLEEENDEI